MGEDQNTNKNSFYYIPSSSTTAAEEDDLLRRIIDDINDLITLSYSIRVFTVKWQVIRKNLEELSSMLMAAEIRPSNQRQKSLSDVIVSISNAVIECRELGLCCVNVSYSGKLLMQSDLDKVISKFGNAIQNVSAVFSSSGVVTGELALVVSKPLNSSSKDDMRFYVKDLLTRIKIGDLQVKIHGLSCLNEAIAEDEKYVKIVVEMDDFLLVLAKCLDSGERKIQEEAVFAMAMISGFEACRGVLVVSGVIGPLIRVVENGSLKAKKFAVCSLEKLTRNGDNAWALSAHGGVPALLSLCCKDESDDELIGPCCWVLRNLVGVYEIKQFMIDEAAVSTCIQVIRVRNEVSQVGACELLQSLVLGDETVRLLVIKEGGARALVKISDPKSNYSFKLRETALRVIEDLCFASVEHVHLLISYGFVDNLLYFLRKGDVSIQELAFKSACRLCGTSEDARKSMGDHGFMVEFVKFLEAKSYEIREMAAEALSMMVLVPKNRKKFSADDYNIGVILQLLDPKQGNSGNFKFLLSIILSISSCNHARRKIASSSYVKNIENLAENGVSDAKKIVRKLSANRFKNMLNGIWHS